MIEKLKLGDYLAGELLGDASERRQVLFSCWYALDCKGQKCFSCAFPR
jgi:hypothetical protein